MAHPGVTLLDVVPEVNQEDFSFFPKKKGMNISYDYEWDIYKQIWRTWVTITKDGVEWKSIYDITPEEIEDLEKHEVVQVLLLNFERQIKLIDKQLNEISN